MNLSVQDCPGDFCSQSKRHVLGGGCSTIDGSLQLQIFCHLHQQLLENGTSTHVGFVEFWFLKVSPYFVNINANDQTIEFENTLSIKDV